MKTSLAKRLMLLEARVPSDDVEHLARLRISFSALFDAFGTRAAWAKAKTAPFYLEEQPSAMAALWKRIQACTTTESDRAALAGMSSDRRTTRRSCCHGARQLLNRRGLDFGDRCLHCDFGPASAPGFFHSGSVTTACRQLP